MITRLNTGPGLYAAATKPELAPGLKPGHTRIFCARLEAYDITEDEGEIEFKILPAMSTDSPEIASALLQLLQCLQNNKAALLEAAKAKPSSEEPKEGG